MLYMKKYIVTTLLALGACVHAFAIDISFSFGTSATNNTGLSLINNLITQANGIVAKLVPLTVGLGLVAFFWYLVKFIWKADEDPKAREEGLKGMGYSILAIFVMVSIWGIIALMGSMLGIGQGGSGLQIEMPKAR
jgi:hypothetical protein